MRALAQWRGRGRRDPRSPRPAAGRRGRGAARPLVQRQERLHASVRHACAGVRQDAQASRGALTMPSL